jgi:hypothetical protein
MCFQMVKNGLYFGVVYRVIKLVTCKAINLIHCVEKLPKIQVPNIPPLTSNLFPNLT